MANVNVVHLIGNVGKDPQTMTFDSGTSKASFTLATTKKIKEEQVTQWHNIVAWGKVAEIIGKYVKKGDPLYVQGEITYRSYEDKDGVKKFITEINCTQVQLLGKKPQQEPESAEIFPASNQETDIFDTPPPPVISPQQNTPDDDLPF